jgi:hypothetical protein
MGSGYTDCKCPDCFEVAISDDENEPDFCNACEEAGCDGEGECEAPHAYCSDSDEVEGSDGKAYCAECGQPF